MTWFVIQGVAKLELTKENNVEMGPDDLETVKKCEVLLHDAMEACKKVDPTKKGYASAMTALLFIVLAYADPERDIPLFITGLQEGALLVKKLRL